MFKRLIIETVVGFVLNSIINRITRTKSKPN